MLGARRVWVVLVGAWVGAFLGRALFEWLLGLDEPWRAIGILGAAAAGGLLSLGEAHRLGPMPPHERRDAVLGWGALVGGVGAVACLFLPMPWGALAALAVLVVTVIALRRVPPAPRGTPSP
jgi:hypothetical protein